MGKLKKNYKSGSEKKKIKEKELLKKQALDPKQLKITFGKLIINSTSISTASNLSPSNGPTLLKDVPIISEESQKTSEILMLEDIPTISEESQTTSEILINEDFPTISEECQTNCDGILMSESKELGLFITPKYNATTTEKLCFLKNHPIHPSGDINKLPFDSYTLYHRIMPNLQTIKRNWLSYSIILNKIYCFICTCFSDSESPFRNGITPSRKTVYEKVEVHEQSKSHQMALMAYLLAKKNLDIESRIKKLHSVDVEQKRQVLKRIIDIIIFIGSQGLAFRGKNESAFSLENNDSHGNFLALVLFLAKYDSVLSQHVTQSIKASKCRKDSHPTSKGRGNLITFLSKTTVNKLVKICGNRVKLAISNHVKDAQKFSLEVDSCQDIGVVDQVAICVRYVRDGVVNERLISMTAIHNTSGRQYFEIIKNIFIDLGIDIKTIISSAFDGASNMSGKYNGLQAALKEIAPDMIYTHCYAHVLNLIMVATCSSCLKAHVFFGLLEKTAVFIGNSFKRVSKWTDNLNEMVEGRDKLRRLQKIGIIRWWAKDRALDTIFDVQRYVVLLKTLCHIAYSKQFEAKVAFEAQSIMKTFLQFEIILTAFVFKKLFMYTTPTSKYLQTISFDYLTAHQMLLSLQEKFSKMAHNSESVFNDIYEDAYKFASSVNKSLFVIKDFQFEVELTLTQNRKRTVVKKYDEKAVDESNTMFLSEKHEFRVNVYQVVFDTVSTQLLNRFHDTSDLMQDASYLDPRRFNLLKDKHLPEKALKSLSKISRINRDCLVEQLKSFASTYFNKLGTSTSYNSNKLDRPTLNELNSDSEEISDNEQENYLKPCAFENYCKKCIPCVCKFLRDFNLHSSAYSELYIAYETLLTISFTQVTCERRFSKLKILKTRLRSLMAQDLLESLILLNCESDIVLKWDYDSIIDELANTSNELKRILF